MEEELQKMKTNLPKGYTRTLAKEFGVTDVTVCNSLNGKTRRFDIIKRAIEMARKNIAIKKELKKIVGEEIFG